MQASQDYPQPDDELAALAAGGDQAAFAALYERYFGGIFDFALRTARDQDAAAKAVQRTFTVAWEGMRRGWGGHNVKGWLYTIARNSALDELRHAKGVPAAGEEGEGGSPPPFARTDPATPSSAEAVLEDDELAETVWSSAAALRPKQYSLLDMHLRQRLTADELAESLRLTRGNVFAMLTRLRGALAESVTYTLLIRRGRRECRELDYLLSESKADERTRQTRRALRDHLRTCTRCQTSKRGYVSPLAVFAALALVPAAPGVKESIWHSVLSQINGIPAAGGRAARARLSPQRANLPLVAAAGGGGVGLLAILLAGVLVFGSDGGGTAPVRDPADVHSTDRETGEKSSDSTIEIAWTLVPGVEAYSIMWTQGRSDLPDTEGDLPGSATGAKSPSLEPGRWYFHLRTQGESGRWTSTVHLGPFEVSQDDDSPRGTATPTPSPETGTPGPTPQFPTATAAPPTETPPPAPAATPTVTATAAPTETPAPEPSEASTPTPALTGAPTFP